MSGRPDEVLLIQNDSRQVERTLDVLRNRRFARRIRVIRDAAEGLEFLLGSGPYADQRPAAPRLVLFHLSPGEDHHLAVLERIVGDPLTSRFPVTVLTDTADDRLAVLSLLRARGFRLPVVAITDLPSGAADRSGDAQERLGDPGDQEDGAWILAGAGERRASRGGRRASDAAPRDASESGLARQMGALIQLARGLAHEFNNLLTVMATNTELLMRGLDPTDPRRESAEEILRAVDRASRVTTELMTLERAAGASSPDEPDASSRPAAGGDRPGAR